MDAVTIHYHGLPVTPNGVLMSLAGKHFMVSYFRPDQVEFAHKFGQAVRIDNGAFSFWKKSGAASVAWWLSYYDFCAQWFDWATTDAIIPDVIDAGSQEQDALLREWPHGKTRGLPVWHMDEPVHRLLRLCDEWPKVAIGSTAEYAVVGAHPWRKRMDEAFGELAARHRWMPYLHMLRGMQCAEWGYPFAAVDSTDVARNHNRPSNKSARHMADAWDSKQCPGKWVSQPLQLDLEHVA